MNAVEIAEAVAELVEQPFDRAEFPYNFLLAFGNPESTIKRLKSGDTNRSDIGGVLQRNNIHIVVCDVGTVAKNLEALRDSAATSKQKAQFIFATDGNYIEAEDLKSGETLACEFCHLDEAFGFFLSLAGIVAVKEIRESAFDIKATGRLNKLYIELLRFNPEWSSEEKRHEMNHFMARLIFCFFAEDTGIFKGNDLLTSTIEQMTLRDASNVHLVLGDMFQTMNTKHADRDSLGLPKWANVLPYVNGGLFAGSVDVPKFSKIARSYLLHIGKLDWKKINPDVFGSMIQAVADDSERDSLGMHYTSVPNILKVLKPLFLDELHDLLERCGNNHRKLLNLRKRISAIRIFDPACGSGNFLVIAYKELRKIEAEINLRRGEPTAISTIPITNYRGIEIRDFAAEIARLALIIAEFQCDAEYLGESAAIDAFLPLNDQNWIACGNSLRLDWASVCPPSGQNVKYRSEDLLVDANALAEVAFDQATGETFICGNPPFAGQKKKTPAQRDDMRFVMHPRFSNIGDLDYVAAFFVKAADYLKLIDGSAAFVATNSICQGRQVPILWSRLTQEPINIQFGYTSFLWRNNAKRNASVYCVIVCITSRSGHEKYLFTGSERKSVSRINGYLIPSQHVDVLKRKTPLSKDLELMKSGNMPLDNGNLILSAEERVSILKTSPAAERYIKKLIGAKEINQGLERFCLWIGDNDVQDALEIPEIAARIQKCKEFRQTSSAPELASLPHAFRDRHRQKNTAIVLSNLSSERRHYRTPIIVNKEVVPSNLALAIYDGDLFQFAILSSRLHHVWVEAVCGKLKQDYRYSNDLGWHTFPLPKLTSAQKQQLKQSAETIILTREKHFPKSLNELYNHTEGETQMPADLMRVHQANDEIVERIFIGRLFKNDTERLDKLFTMYSKMTGTLDFF